MMENQIEIKVSPQKQRESQKILSQSISKDKRFSIHNRELPFMAKQKKNSQAFSNTTTTNNNKSVGSSKRSIS